MCILQPSSAPSFRTFSSIMPMIAISSVVSSPFLPPLPTRYHDQLCCVMPPHLHSDAFDVIPYDVRRLLSSRDWMLTGSRTSRETGRNWAQGALGTSTRVRPFSPQRSQCSVYLRPFCLSTHRHIPRHRRRNQRSPPLHRL